MLLVHLVDRPLPDLDRGMPHHLGQLDVGVDDVQPVHGKSQVQGLQHDHRIAGPECL